MEAVAWVTMPRRRIGRPSVSKGMETGIEPKMRGERALSEQS
jgi:hypothetical protein